MPGSSKHSSIVYDNHVRGRAVLEGNLVSVKPDSSEKCKEFLPLGFTAVWAAQMESQKDSTDRVSMPEDTSDPHAS